MEKYKVYYQMTNHPIFLGSFATTGEAIDYIATQNEKDLIEMTEEGEFTEEDKWSIWNENINRYVIINTDQDNIKA